MKTKKLLIILLLISVACYTQNTEQRARQKIDQLNQLITNAKNKGIDVTKEKMSLRVADIFLEYAKWDQNHKGEVAADFRKAGRVVPNSAVQKTPEEYANLLPEYER